MKTHRWRDIRNRNMTAEQIAALDRQVEADMLELDLRAIRELAGKTQVEMAEALASTQSEVSRLERRSDHKLSTLRRVVEALGGELEVVATFGPKRVRLSA